MNLYKKIYSMMIYYRIESLRVLIAIAMLTLIAYLASERTITKVYYNSALNSFASYTYDQPFYPLIPVVYAILTIIFQFYSRSSERAEEGRCMLVACFQFYSRSSSPLLIHV